ncbi:MAG: NAD+ synthase [Candidatus Omnitrophica bacterium]|nr:NAD+ synthase [Candidatus Omnitrophota bacterium]
MKKKIISWIREEIKASKAKGLVIGVSGGIDSAVVASLACEALGKEKVLGLILPCESQIEDIKDAKLICKRLGIRNKTVDLTPIFKALIKILPKADKLALGNLKSRLRMLVLYYFANKLNYLVCGTSNKSERMIGYFTKYGDGASDILPIADLLKTQVRKLAYQLNIPEKIINKVPTAGLWPGQTDEEEIHLTYNELDDILFRWENKKRQVLPKQKVERVKEMILRSEHKRKGPKICFIHKEAKNG